MSEINYEKARILDACCGSRMFHFDKKNPHVLFMDNRNLKMEYNSVSYDQSESKNDNPVKKTQTLV